MPTISTQPKKRKHLGVSLEPRTLTRQRRAKRSAKRKMILRPANTIADALLAKFAKRGFLMSNLKLQKLLYYMQGYHLAKIGSVAFNDQLKAWSHGPVIPVVYHRFKKFSWHDIVDIPAAPVLPEKTQDVIDFVFKKMGSYTAFELEEMTHGETPWIEARKGLPLGAPQSPEIPVRSIRSHFATLV